MVRDRLKDGLRVLDEDSGVRSLLAEDQRVAEKRSKLQDRKDRLDTVRRLLSAL